MAGGRLSAFAASYAALVDVVEGLGEDAAWTPTRCLGWSVRDLVFHLHADATRGLVALHTPADRPADCDSGRLLARLGLRLLVGRAESPVHPPRGRLVRLARAPLRYLEYARAAARGIAEADPSQVVATQGHALSLPDLASTLAVEATLHHLDLVHQLPPPGPSAAGLAEVRRVVEALLDRDLVGWSDERVSLVGTGRDEPTSAELEDLGPAVVPVFT